MSRHATNALKGYASPVLSGPGSIWWNSHCEVNAKKATNRVTPGGESRCTAGSSARLIAMGKGVAVCVITYEGSQE